MKGEIKARARVYLAPSSEMTTWTLREIFTQADIESIENAVGKPLAPETKGRKKQDLAVTLNKAAEEFFKCAADERVGSPTDFADWSRRISKAAADLLRALGIDPDKPGQPLSEAAFVALCRRPTKSLTSRDYGVQDHRAALAAVANGTAFIHDLGEHAALYHASRVAPVKRRASRPGLSSRQKLILLLAQAYEASFVGRVPRAINPSASPFVRFVCWVCSTLADRMRERLPEATAPAHQSVLPHKSHPDLVRFLIAKRRRRKSRGGGATDEALAADCAAAAALANISGAQIAGDLRSRVHAKLRAPRP